MKQTRLMSLIETLTNILVGFFVSLISQIYIFAAYGIHVSLGDNLAITAYFTGISIIRSYCLRRWFEHLRVKGVSA